MKFFNVKTVDETVNIIETHFAPIHEPVRVSIRERWAVSLPRMYIPGNRFRPLPDLR